MNLRIGNLKKKVENIKIHRLKVFPEKPYDLARSYELAQHPCTYVRSISVLFKNVDGPAWPWWVLAVIPAEDKIKMHVLAQTSLAKRLTLMSRVIACIITQSSAAPR